MGKKRRKLGKIKGFIIQFLPYSEIRDLDSDDRIKKILNIILGNNILILQGKLNSDEETRLIGDTMAMIGHVKNFKGIELAVISGNDDKTGFYKSFKYVLASILTGGDVNAITIIGHATIVKEMKRNTKKIEFLLNE